MDRISDRVHASLRSDILAGTLAPGDAVPSERRLAEDLGVNRHAVREALKRLEQAGLITISQGGATRVRDWRDTGGLEILLDLQSGTEPPADLARSVLELRASVGVDAARRCAERADAEALARVEELAESTAAAMGQEGQAVDDGYAQLWRAVVLGSGNLAYRLALNSLMAALAAYPEVAGVVRPAEPKKVRALGRAIAAADPAKAERAARALLEPDIDAFG
ncbi:MAG TPA: GntR family transcriptional regulator [Thermoleophilaceae bacterium]|nr:GntR family transcriptional regulator [Thermoleophilaceae bacterium]